MKLTVKKVERLRDPGRYGDGRGLYLQVTSKGAKSWIFRYERGGKESFMGLGSAADWTLDEARDRAREARRMLAEGRDPLEEKRALRAEKEAEKSRKVTFAEAAALYFEKKSDEWSNQKHRAQFISTLRKYAFWTCPVFVPPQVLV